MSYLYGDSSAAALEINFIDFLRDVVDFSVQVLIADQHIKQGEDAAAIARRVGEAEVDRLETLGGVMSRAVDGAALGEAGSPTARCAEAILRSSVDLVQAEIGRVRANVKVELDRGDGQAARERANCVQALSALLLRHDLPGWVVDLKLEQQGGARYTALLHGKAPFGLEVTLELEIPAAHLMAHVLRLDKIFERLEVQAPEAGGWLRKEVKLRPQKLEKEYVTALHIGAGETTLKLRANPDGSGAGCDLTVRAQAPRVSFVRAGESDQTPFELAEPDAARIVELQEKLVLACADLMHSRKGLTDAQLDGKPLGAHADPKAVAERLIETITPTVQEIAKRSLSPTELVLKRQLDSGRREEIFISRDELKQKLTPLNDAQRALFVPLGLADFPAVPAPWKPAPSSLTPKSELVVVDDGAEEDRTVVDAKPR